MSITNKKIIFMLNEKERELSQVRIRKRRARGGYAVLNRCFKEKVLRALAKQIYGQRVFPTKGTAVQRP